MKTRRICLLVFAMIWIADPARAATATNVQVGGSTEYWVNNNIWNPASYPGSGPGESASFTANVGDGYTTILNATLPNSLSAISILNAGSSTWLIVTNGLLVNSMLNLNTGGGIAIDYRGIVTNLNSVTMGGTGSKMVIRNGGSLTTTGIVYVGTGGASIRDNLTIVGGAGVTSVVNAGNAALNVGINPGANNSFIVDGGGVFGSALGTNLASILIGYQLLAPYTTFSNSVIVTNGGVLSVGSAGISMANNWPQPYGRLEVVQGGQLNLAGSISMGAGASCRVIVRDPGSLLRGSAAAISVGLNLSSNNLLEISNYGVVSNFTIAVSTTAGANGNMYCNAMRITGGGKLYGYGGGANYIGLTEYPAYPAGRGAYCSTGIVSGTDSLWDLRNATLTVGHGGISNELWISDGGTITNGATLAVGSPDLGIGGNVYPSVFSRMVITNGGRVFSTAGGIGTAGSNNGPSNSNRVDVTGINSLWDLGGGNLIVGGTATYTGNVVVIDQGGMVDRVGTLTVVSNNAVELRGGTLVVSSLSYNNGFVFTVGDGVQSATLKTTAGPGNIRNGLLVNSNGVLGGKGIINAGSSGVIVTNKGAVEPGVTGVGALTNAGPFTLAAGSFARFKIATNSTAGAGWDLMVVTNGTLTLGGAIQPLMVDDYKPAFSDSFIVMSNKPAFSISGDFDNTIGGGRVTAYNTDRTRVVGSFRVGVSNQYVVLDNFRPHYGGIAVFVK